VQDSPHVCLTALILFSICFQTCNSNDKKKTKEERGEEERRGLLEHCVLKQGRESKKKSNNTQQQTSQKTHPRGPPSFLLSQPMAENDTRVKPWGKVDKAALHKLVVDGHVDIEDLTFDDINRVREQYFPHPPSRQASTSRRRTQRGSSCT
jgi:hypothetical protein